MRYPETLVHEYGAKAGILMYVGEKIPSIPQMPMIVSGKDEPPQDFLKRVAESGLDWPIIFRSSAIEELVGYEGDFPSYVIDDSFYGENNVNKYLVRDGKYELYADDSGVNEEPARLIEKIASAPRVRFPDRSLTPRINVIAAKVAHSKYTGTYIQHPNNRDFYVTTLMERNEPNGITTFTYGESFGVRNFDERANRFSLPKAVKYQLAETTRWHDVIGTLPDMDPGWAYQIEFGLDPLMLFQVRPFKSKERADFRLNQPRGPEGPIVIGITPKEGIDFTVSSNSRFAAQSPHMLFTDLRDLRMIPDLEFQQAYLLQDGGGILAHKDVKPIRQSELCVIYPGYIPFPVIEGMNVNVVSDGVQVQFTPK